MDAPSADYDSRYLAGVELFNAGEYFDAHEVWEDLWLDCPSADRRFYQSLIQAAVALYHWARGNRAGAARLFHSGRRYMEPYRPHRHGLDVDAFWLAVAAAMGGEENLTPQPPSLERKGEPAESKPRIVLVPPPARWPDPCEARHD